MAKEIEKKASGAVAMNDMLNQMAIDSQENSGFENVGIDDMALPFLRILQALSPQVRGETKIKGAEEGDFYNTVTEELFKSPVKLVPCAYRKAYIEWVDRKQGGGFVGERDITILEKTKRIDGKDMLENGNTIEATAYHFCLLIKPDGSYQRVLLALTSTQLKKSRRWNSQMTVLLIDVNGKKLRPPMYSHIYTVSSETEKKDQNEWKGYKFGEPTLITDQDIYAAARKFSEDVNQGQVKVAPPTPDSDIAHEPAGDNNIL